MKKTVSACLIALSFLLSAQASFARNPLKDLNSSNHHSAAGVALGNFGVDCSSGGSGNADVRTIVVNSHNQQVVHLNASNFTQAGADVESLDTTVVTVQTPINFRLVKGNGNWLAINVVYTPHGSTTQSSLIFTIPNAKVNAILVGEINSLIDNGNGALTIPLEHNGTVGIPQGAQLNALQFTELGNNANCVNHVSDINGLTINNRPIGIDTTALSASCTNDCVVNGGGGVAE